MVAMQNAVQNQTFLFMGAAEGLPDQFRSWAGDRLTITPDFASLRSASVPGSVVLIDWDAPQAQEAFQFLASIKGTVRLVVITASNDADQFLAAGASAVITRKPEAWALRAACEDRKLAGPSNLTPRETEVLDCMARGRTNGEIGVLMGISVKTVEAHRARIFRRLGSVNIAQAIMTAVKTGLLDPNAY